MYAQAADTGCCTKELSFSNTVRTSCGNLAINLLARHSYNKYVPGFELGLGLKLGLRVRLGLGFSVKTVSRVHCGCS